MLLMLVTSILASSLIVVFHILNDFLLRRRTPRGSRIPPMPPANSMRGHTEIVRSDFDRNKFLQWTKEYGPVVRLRMNFRNIVLLNDYDSMKKFCNVKELLWRPSNFLGNRDLYLGLLTLNGEPWAENRKFCLRMLRDVGFAKTASNDRMMEEVSRIVEEFGKTGGKPVDANQYLIPCVFNNIASFFYGSQVPHDHPSRRELNQVLLRVSAAVKGGLKFNFYPSFLRKLLAKLPFTPNGRLNKAVKELDAVSEKQVELYKAAKYGDETKDFINGYLKKIEECKMDSKPFFTDHYLVGNINSFLLGGTFSTTISINMHLVNFAKHHDTLQARAQQEIDDVVGRDRLPTWDDHTQLPFILACVWEVFRWQQFSTLGTPRECVEDVVIDDYFIPKGTVVYPNIWAVNHDPRHWKDPAKFDPGRYLNEDGSISAPKPEHLVTFSVGRRACPGEMFATVEIFLAITHLLQKYRILLEKPLEYDLDSLETQLLRINGIKLRFLPRQAGDSSKTN